MQNELNYFSSFPQAIILKWPSLYFKYPTTVDIMGFGTLRREIPVKT